MARGRGAFEFRLTGRWREFDSAINPYSKRNRGPRGLQASINSATMRNAHIVRSEIIKRIRKGKYHKNAPLTVAIKNSRKALIDHGDLVGSIKVFRISDDSAFVGVHRNEMTKDGSRMADLAQYLHDGDLMRVTPRVRLMFFYLWLVSTGQASEYILTGDAVEIWQRIGPRGVVIYPIGPNTEYLLLPRRPFIEEVFEDKALAKELRMNWVMAIRGATRA